MTLDQLPIGRKARIVDVDWASLVSEEARRLRALGLEEGAQVSIAHRGVFGGRDPIALSIGRMTVAVRRAHAAAISVDLIEADEFLHGASA
ncbi:ferrous iron transport protein A [Novosphingobium sp. YJ-S2-02]|uniref:Ferrous iron transport protein A n=1 Tax=Novosphingobium aureum TaxID=2792964 RepID=A0A931HEG1_9SPHN|nr:FeoA family protein [Novosphingobium aureum]MBH0113928.1 ferrous iron transport protein A [Novosphingobium aureum]